MRRGKRITEIFAWVERLGDGTEILVAIHGAGPVPAAVVSTNADQPHEDVRLVRSRIEKEDWRHNLRLVRFTGLEVISQWGEWADQETEPPR